MNTSANSSSTSSAPTTVGFWKNGVWQPRPRTPPEERSHRGGSGPRRTQRKYDRVQSYLAGDWKPAWMVSYIADRKRREAGDAASNEEDVDKDVVESTGVCTEELTKDTMEATLDETTPPAEPTSHTDPDPWSGQWGGDNSQWWWTSWSTSSSWWDGWSWSSSSTTSPPPLHDFAAPNFGLYPDVNPVGHEDALADLEGDHIWRMQLTESERALPRGGGIPEGSVQRLEDLFQRLEDYDSFELGPESRWALARLSRRVDEATEALGTLLEVMLRRLRPRGRWPVVRTPRNEVDQLRMFNWVRRFSDVFVNTLQFNLDVPLQPREDLNELSAGETPAIQDEPNVEPPAQDDQEDDMPLPVHPAGGVGEIPLGANDATTAIENPINVEPEAEPPLETCSSSSDNGSRTTRSRSRTPNPPPRLRHLQQVVATEGLQRALNGELMGVWHDEEDTARLTTTSSTTSLHRATTLRRTSNGTTSSTRPSPTWSSSSTSSWTSCSCSSTTPCASSTSPSCASCSPSQWHGLTVEVNSWSCSTIVDVVNSSLGVFLDYLFMLDELPGAISANYLFVLDELPGATSSSTTSTTTENSQHSAVRDAVGREVLMGGEADLVEVAHRLLARSRLLLRYQQNLMVALEEALGWFQLPPAAVPFNAPTMETQIWRTISQAASSEGDAGVTVQGSAGEASAPIVLLQPGFPSTGEELSGALPGMSLTTAAGLRRRAWQINAGNVIGAGGPSGGHGADDPGDCDLYLLQTDPSSLVPVPENCGALPRQSSRGLRQHRRRLRAPRPLPVVRDAEWMTRDGSSRRPEATPDSRPRDRRQRDRSRSRDE